MVGLAGSRVLDTRIVRRAPPSGRQTRFVWPERRAGVILVLLPELRQCRGNAARWPLGFDHQNSVTMSELAAKRDELLGNLRGLEGCAVAFSAGVDSAVVAKAAQLALGQRAVAVTAVSPSLAEGELDEARRVAAEIGIRHLELATHEAARAEYVANGPDRCYHCKRELYTELGELCEKLDLGVVVNGVNADDAFDYRPGLQAATEHRVRSPLLECGIDKATVRQLAREWQLSVAEKPAAPCLASRLAYGEEVLPERLEMIDRAEQWLRAEGFPVVRVRYHHGDLARIEVPLDDLERLLEADRRQRVGERLREFGFRYITFDLEGFRSGSQNELLPVEQLRAFRS